MRLTETKKQKAFTLIELLVVIAIIGLLASIVLVGVSNARLKSKIAKRGQDLKQVQSALELYYNTNNSYPSTGGQWQSQCAAYGGVAANNVIPGLVPNYLASMPVDPAMNTTANTNCYVYISIGTDYKFMHYNLTDMSPSDVGKIPPLIDPRRNSQYIIICGQGMPEITFSIYTLGARCW